MSTKKNNASPLAYWYGAGTFYVLEMTLLGAGTGNAPTIPAVSGTVPPCAIEITKVTNTATGVNTLTFADSYWAVAAWNVSVDDVNAATPVSGYLGQFANLEAAAPTTAGAAMTCVLSTYTTGSSAVDVALNTPIRITIVFKKNSTGAAA